MGKKIGRPTKLTPAVQLEICERIACGESLVRILKSDPKFPDYSNITRALERDGTFRTKYARAREDAADYLAQEILDIADDPSNDYYVGGDDGKTLLVDHDHIQRSKLRVDTRKWIASKLKPKKYGDRTTLAGDEENPLQVGIKYYPIKKPVGVP